VDLPLRETFHPMGYKVEVSSNSARVLEAAAGLWRRYPAVSDAEPLRIRVVGAGPRPDAFRHKSRPRGEGHLFSIVHGAYDYAFADLTGGFAFAVLSEESLNNSAHLCYYFLEPLVYVMLGANYFAFVHASCISRNGRALLLCGESGAGKTCLAYACAKRGWDYLSGDAVHIVRQDADRTVIGRPYEIRFRESARAIFPELNCRPAAARPNGKIDLELDTEELGIPTSFRSAARHLVFIERSNVTRLEKYPAGLALENLQATISYGGDRTRFEQRETLMRFAGLPAWRLQYADFDSAARTLKLLLGEE